jgi:peptidoglycan hydrolase CwlO-like protein
MDDIHSAAEEKNIVDFLLIFNHKINHILQNQEELSKKISRLTKEVAELKEKIEERCR